VTAVRPCEPRDVVRGARGSSEYLEAVEQRLIRLFEGGSDVVDRAAAQTLRAGGKLLRPLLAFLSSPPDRPAPVSAGVAVELIHLASLVHDDMLDEATVRRGVPSTWSAFGEHVALTTGDCLFALAFTELARDGDPRALSTLAEAALALARGEALQREQRFDPSTTVEERLRLCALKTGALFSAACRLGARDPGSSLGDYGLALGIAFQIVDDVLDCAGESDETGKAPGADLREGIPTLPLLLAAERDTVVRAALAGGSYDGILERVASSGALERSRRIALDYADRACAHLDGDPRSRELEALAQVVVERTR
jgi:geranylgeranyl pyrophosphate synthase